MTSANERHGDPAKASSWYDFICPFCYVGQSRTAILVRRGVNVTELPFQAHPDIPPGGIQAGPRSGPMYMRLEREADAAGLPLKWPARIPNSRVALAAAEWARRHQPPAFPHLQQGLFNAHFVLGEDLEDMAVIDRHAGRAGVDLEALHAAIADGSATAAVRDAEMIGQKAGVHGTPAWLLGEELISGLLPATEFEQLADRVMRSA